MSLLARFGVVLVAMGALVAMQPGPGPAAAAATVTVNIGDNFYANSPTNTCPSPPSACVTPISVGDTVHWVWTGSNPHSTTSDTGTPGVACGVSTQPWDSGTHGNGFTCNVTFNTPGSFSYHCTVHPTMQGTIVVTAPSVGGVARLPDAANGSPAAAPASSGSSVGLIAGSAAITAGLVALGGAAWYARRRRVS